MHETLANSIPVPDDKTEPCPEKPIIRILIYTDDPISVTDDELIPFGVGRLKKHLKLHEPAFAKLCVELKSRNEDEDNHANCRLDDSILKAKEPYHQIWFFGIHQVNRSPYTLEFPVGGGPRSELEDDEVEGLKCWMATGGVLIAGDHANPDPRSSIPSGDQFCPVGVNHETFLGLGRAIGHKVPRAGELRKWKGPPTRCTEDNFNTQVLTTGTDYEEDTLEKDATPQEVLPEFFDDLGNPVPRGGPHPLFTDRYGRPIKVFPDHMHEGRLVFPEKLDKKLWLKVNGVQPRPYAVAYGIDRSERTILPIVAAYDGHRAGVGRIVADSTWHHYFNDNLTMLRAGEGDGPHAESIGQYYGNLALWLSPAAMLRAMACVMFHWLASQPRIMEEAGSGALNVGRTALSLLTQVASPCEIQELLQVFVPALLRAKFEMLRFPPKATADSWLPSQELILGLTVSLFHQAATASPDLLMSEADAAKRDETLIQKGLRGAFIAQADALRRSERDARSFFKLFT